MSGVVRFKDINTDTFTPDAPEKMKNGMGYLIRINGPQIQTPVCRIPWDTRVDDSQGRPQCKVALSLTKEDENHTTFSQRLDMIDQGFIDIVSKNKKDLFKKKISDNLISELFYPSAKPSKDDKYGPTFSPKVSFIERSYHDTPDEDGKRSRLDGPTYNLNIDCCDKKKTQISPDVALAKGSKVALLCKPQHIWVINDRCGVSWQATAALVTELQQKEPSFTQFDMSEFNDDDDNNGNNFHDEEIQAA